MAMRVVARQGPRVFLLAEEEPLPGWPPDREAHVLDMDAKTLGPAISLGAVLARGYWEPYDAPLGNLLDGVTRDPGSLMPRRRT